MNRLALCLLVLMLVGCGRATGHAATTYTDPFAYCAAVGTVDAPDARYVGESVPDSVAKGLRKAFGLRDTAPLEPFKRNSYWRCMGGKVYACNVGANLPCQEKADVSREPSVPMFQWCSQNPDSAVIPAVVTGRATVYQWRCMGKIPQIVRQLTKPDAQGFLSNVWYEIGPGE